MSATKTLALIATALLLPASGPAQDSAVPAQDSALQVSGSLSTGARSVDNDTASSKLTEYRDLDDDAYVPGLTLSVFDPDKRRYFDFTGSNVSLEDQRLHARGGAFGTWRVGADWTSVPHNFSNKAQTPYLRRGPGLLGASAPRSPTAAWSRTKRSCPTASTRTSS